MGHSRAIVAGTILGGVAAVGIYAAVAAPAASPVKPAAGAVVDSAQWAESAGGSALRPRPVPTFTKVVQAPCSAPSVLEHGVCVTHVVGRPTVIPAPPAVPAPAEAARNDPAAAGGVRPPGSAGPATSVPLQTGTPSAVTAGTDEDEDAAYEDDDQKDDGEPRDRDDHAPDGR